MSEAKLEIELPSKLLFLLRETEESFKEKGKVWTSIKLFEDKKLSLDQAAEFAGYSKVAYIEILGKSRIAIFNYPAEELEEDIKNMKKLLDYQVNLKGDKNDR
jgi:predicted HTH domain antitoxin